MSTPAENDIEARAVCDFCGFFIDEPEQSCPARDEGVCRP